MSNFVEFVSHKRKYILATDTGLAARRCVAQSLTADALRDLRRPPSRSADWDRTTNRLPGEDVLTLAHRVVDAYILRSGSRYDANSVWHSAVFTEEINSRFARCLNADESCPARGEDSTARFYEEWETRRAAVERGVRDQSTVSCIAIAEEFLAPREASRAHCGLYDLNAIDADDDNASVASTHSAGSRRTGRGSHDRRRQLRLALTAPSPYRDD